MNDRGRDIPPDEDRLNYVYPNSYNGDHRSVENDLVEDAGPPNHHREMSVFHGFRSRNGIHVHEPVDLSTDSAETIYGRVFPSQRQFSSPDRHYQSEANRLSTFSDWRYQSVVRKEDLAKNGLVFTGAGDKVRCVYCNGILRQWDRGDVVEEEHRRNFPTCPFILGQNVGNIPMEPGSSLPDQVRSSNHTTVSDARSLRTPNRGHDIDPLEEGYGASYNAYIQARCQSNDAHENDAVAGRNNTTGDDTSPRRGYSNSPRNPSMAVEPVRLATFSSWPAQMKQKPEVLAQAGLYYIGESDKVKCFHCDSLLYNWEPDDDPFVEHARWFPECQYIKLVKGEKFVDDVQNGRVTQDEVMQTPAVLAVLYEGYSVDSVQRALATMREKNGADVVVSAQNLLMTIMELEDNAKDNMNGHVSSEEMKKLQMENESLRDKQLCKICMERDVEVIFLPCKHFVCCASCSTAVRECPICRVAIASIEKIFMV